MLKSKYQYSIADFFWFINLIAVSGVLVCAVVDRITPTIVAFIMFVVSLALHINTRELSDKRQRANSNQPLVTLALCALFGSFVGEIVSEFAFYRPFFSIGYAFSPSPITWAMAFGAIYFGPRAIAFVKKPGKDSN